MRNVSGYLVMLPLKSRFQIKVRICRLPTCLVTLRLFLLSIGRRNEVNRIHQTAGKFHHEFIVGSQTWTKVILCRVSYQTAIIEVIRWVFCRSFFVDLVGRTSSLKPIFNLLSWESSDFIPQKVVEGWRHQIKTCKINIASSQFETGSSPRSFSTELQKKLGQDSFAARIVMST